MTNQTCDNDCTQLGWTEALIEMGTYSLHVSYPPETDLDDCFRAFCHDEQEMIRINGWLIESHELVEA